jgi:hypothetical protein
MNEEANWQTSNAQYLATAVAWLHCKLEQRAALGQDPLANSFHEPFSTSELLKPTAPSVWQRIRGARPMPAPPAQALLQSPAPIKPETDRTAQLAIELTAFESQLSTPPALIGLARRLGLSNFEREVLLLCAAMELDTSIASLCARAQGDPSRNYPTFALALTLFDAPAWDALSPERPLRYWRLLEINQSASQPMTTSPLRIDERIVSFLKGLNYVDDRLALLLTPMELQADDLPLPVSQQSVADSICERLKQVAVGESLPIIQLL